MVKKETSSNGGNAPSPSDNAVLCAAVHQFLTGVDPKLAKMFKYKNHKINKDLSGDVPEDLPSLGQIVASYQVISIFQVYFLNNLIFINEEICTGKISVHFRTLSVIECPRPVLSLLVN